MLAIVWRLMLLQLGVFGMANTKAVPEGTWAGEHVVVQVDGGSAQVEFDCAHGTIPDFKLASDGSFDAAGTFIFERPGPVRRDDKSVAHDAKYAGRVDGRVMTLTVTRDGDEVGKFRLEQGAAPRLHKCR
jgi:hypothetical protein